MVQRIYPWTDYDDVVREAVRRRETFATAVRTANIGEAERLGRLAMEHPYAANDVLTGLAASGADPLDPLTGDLAKASGAAEIRNGAGVQVGERANGAQERNLLEKGGGVVQTAARGLFTAAESLLHDFVARPAIAAIESATDDDVGFREAYDAIGESTAGRAARELGLEYNPLTSPFELIAAPFVGATDLYGDEEFLGTGWLPGGKIRKDLMLQRQEAARLVGTAGPNQSDNSTGLSPGRSLIDTITPFEAGSRPFNVASGLVDLAVNIFADPTSIVADVPTKLWRGHRLLDQPSKVVKFIGSTDPTENVPGFVDRLASTLIPGPRRSALGDEAGEIVGGTREGRKLIGWLTEEQDAYRIWTQSGRRFDADTAVALADATDERAVYNILRSQLGTNVRERFGAPRYPDFRERLERVALFHSVPQDHLDLRDKGQMVGNLYNFLRTAHLPEDQVGSLMDRVMRVSTDDLDRARSEVTTIADQALEAVTKQATERTNTGRNWSQEGLAHINRIQAKYNPMTRNFLADERGEQIVFPGYKRKVTLADQKRQVTVEREIPRAFDLKQHAAETVLLPDATTVRRVTSRAGRLLGLPGVVPTVDLLERVTGAWRTSSILRPALAFRVGFEIQARMAAGGHMPGIFSHPAEWLWTRMGHTVANERDLAGGLLKEAREFSDSKASSLAAFHRGRAVPGEVELDDWAEFDKLHPDYASAWAGQLLHRADEPLWRRLAGGFEETDTYNRELPDHLDRVTDWLWNGSGREGYLNKLDADLREQLSTPDAVREYVQAGWASLHALTGGKTTKAATRTGKELHLVDVAGDTELIEGIARGNLLGLDIRGLDADPVLAAQNYKELTRILRDTKLQQGPDHVWGSQLHHMSPKEMRKRGMSQKLDFTFDTMFRWLLGVPTERLAVDPTLKRAYWERVPELVPFMRPELAEDVIARAANAGASSKVLNKMRASISETGEQLEDWAEVDLIAKNFALEERRKLVYDAHMRSNLAEANRLIAPFLDPMREQAIAWSRLLVERPKNIRRAQQIVGGARSSGFFYTDENDNERFAYPGSGQFLRAAFNIGGNTGRVEARYTGRPQGLNLIMGDLVPFGGPVVSLPASVLLPDSSDFDWARELFLPYGEVDLSHPGEALLPAYARKIISGFTGDDSNRQYATTVASLTDALVADGGYLNEEGMLDDESTARLIEDARSKARPFLVIQGLAQAILPTGPETEYRAELTDEEIAQLREAGIEKGVDYAGNAIRFNALAKVLRTMEEESYATALPRFIKAFGYELTMAASDKTKGTAARSASKVGAAWERDNPDKVARYPDVIGLFAPGGPGEELDLDALAAQERAGVRFRLTPEERAMLHNNAIGKTVVEHQERELARAGFSPTSKQGVAALSVTKARLRAAFPGYGETQAIRGRKSPQAYIDQIANAVRDDPTLAATPQGKAAAKYLAAREQELERMRQQTGRSNATLQGRDAAQSRARLRAVANDLVSRAPEFAGMFDMAFSREFPDEQEEVGPVLSGALRFADALLPGYRESSYSYGQLTATGRG